LFVNVVLLFALAAEHARLHFERISWEMEAPSWATYAGTMQCISDEGYGVRRFYRLVPVNNGNGKSVFTGERDNGTEIWSWPSYPDLGEASLAANQAFVEAYNRRMRSFLANAATRPVK
jgi:hypothetical protein